MRTLDTTRPFGYVTPMWIPDGCDRPAKFEQDQMLFDEQKFQIVPGKPAPSAPKVKAAPATDIETAPLDAVPYSPNELIAKANEMPFMAFKKHAKAILGDTCPPGSKAAIVAALQAAVVAYEQRQKKGASMHKGLSWGGVTGDPEAIEAAAPPPAPKPAANGAVDLAAWGRGQANYLHGALMKTFREKYHVQLAERRDMRDFLVDQGVVPAAQARQDV